MHYYEISLQGYLMGISSQIDLCALANYSFAVINTEHFFDIIRKRLIRQK